MNQSLFARRLTTAALIGAAATVAALGVLIARCYMDPPPPPAVTVAFPAPEAKMEPPPTPVVVPDARSLMPVTPSPTPQDVTDQG